MPRRVLAILLALTVLGCGGEKLDVKGSDVTGADFGKRLALTDHNGRAVTLEDFRGRLVVLFFGYTHCPDVCPTTLQDMAQALKRLEPAVAAKVQATRAFFQS